MVLEPGIPQTSFPHFRMKHTNLDQVAELPLRLVRYGAEVAAKSVAVSELSRICLHSDSYDASQCKQSKLIFLLEVIF